MAHGMLSPHERTRKIHDAADVLWHVRLWSGGPPVTAIISLVAIMLYLYSADKIFCATYHTINTSRRTGRSLCDEDHVCGVHYISLNVDVSRGGHEVYHTPRSTVRFKFTEACTG